MTSIERRREEGRESSDFSEVGVGGSRGDYRESGSSLA